MSIPTNHVVSRKWVYFPIPGTFSTYHYVVLKTVWAHGQTEIQTGNWRRYTSKRAAKIAATMLNK